jgi:hypothetical protein
MADGVLAAPRRSDSASSGKLTCSQPLWQVNLLDVNRPVIAPRASKHGIADADILHAYRNPIRRFELDDGLTMLIGPDQAARVTGGRRGRRRSGPVVVHAMECRKRLLAEVGT